jgi:hypothetical protein
VPHVEQAEHTRSNSPPAAVEEDAPQAPVSYVAKFVHFVHVAYAALVPTDVPSDLVVVDVWQLWVRYWSVPREAHVEQTRLVKRVQDTLSYVPVEQAAAQFAKMASAVALHA